MALNFDKISNVVLNRESIRLMVIVVRIWPVPVFNNPTQTSSLEMILVDEHGGKIQATVRRNLLYKFNGLLEEGSVYKMVYFSVLPNSGHYRATFHDFKLVFIFKTTVMKKESESIPMFGFNFVDFNDVLHYDDNYEHLIDVMDVLTIVFPERQYEKDGKVTTMVVMELTGPSGKIECALFGEYVDQLRTFLNEGGHMQVVVVVQLARVKTFRGKTVLQNNMNATKLFFNPDIPEAVSFRNSIAEHGVIDSDPLAVVLSNSREGMEIEFMRQNPKKSISQLDDLKEDGMFIVLATIMDIISEGNWYYLACKCNRAVTLQGSVHFCESCRVPVLTLSPRFKVRVAVADNTGSTVLLLFDRDINYLIQKSCGDLLMESIEDVGDNGYPPLFDSMIGKKLLFKVEAKSEKLVHYETTYPVRRICDDPDIVAMLELAGADYTPTKAIFVPPFSNQSNDVGELQDTKTDFESHPFITPVSLGDDSYPRFNYTPAKRKLDDAFLAVQDHVGSSGVKSDAFIDIEVDVEPLQVLVPIKIEKD